LKAPQQHTGSTHSQKPSLQVQILKKTNPQRISENVSQTLEMSLSQLIRVSSEISAEQARSAKYSKISATNQKALKKISINQ